MKPSVLCVLPGNKVKHGSLQTMEILDTAVIDVLSSWV